MKATRHEPVTPADRDERLYDEKVRLVRPGRLIAGFAMIGVAVIWLAVENVTSPPARQPTSSPTMIVGSTIPSLATAQPFAGGMTDAVVRARPDRVNGRTAPAGASFLVLAVQVVNRSPKSLRVAAGDFALLAGTRRILGSPLPGHDDVFAATGIAPKATEQGNLVFSVPNGMSLVLDFVPRIRGTTPIKWSVPEAGT